MKKLLLASSALVIGLGTQASAAPPLPSSYVLPPGFNWTGFYVGVHMGAGWDRTTFYDPGAVIPPLGLVQSIAPLGSSIDINGGAGFLGGLQGGYNYQFNNHFVVGVAGSYSWTNINGFRLDPFFDGKNGAGIQMGVRTDYLASATGRFGYAWNNFMVYGTGGVGWTHNSYNLQNLTTLGNMVCLFGCDATGSINRTGWVAGVGGEWRISQHWSAMVEYNHYGFDSRDVRFFSEQVPGADAVFRIRQDVDVVKVGVNYRFTPSRP